MKNLRIFVFAVFTIIAARVCADGVSEASRFYDAGDYDAALKEYESVVKSGASDAELYYNMGNAAFKAGNLGVAVLSYERARRLDPSDIQINNNLDYVTSKVEDANRAELKGKKYRVTPDDRSFFGSIHNMIASDHSSNTWACWAAVCFVILIAMAALYIFASNVIVRKVGFFGSLAFMTLTAVFLIFAFSAASRFESRDRGVIMSYKTLLLQEPDLESNPVAAPLSAGTCVDILQVSDEGEAGSDWIKVRLNSDFVGWVKDTDIEVI